MMTSGSSGSSTGSSSTVAFAAGAFAGAALSAASLWYYYRNQQPAANRLPQAAVAASSQPAAAHNASLRDFESDEILAEHLTRNVQFFGLEKQKQIATSFVVVIGLGVSSPTYRQLAVVSVACFAKVASCACSCCTVSTICMMHCQSDFLCGWHANDARFGI
jgi:hypothetical protein